MIIHLISCANQFTLPKKKLNLTNKEGQAEACRLEAAP
jgi:hypothetical protein